MPFACGVMAATIVLPADSQGWTLERRRAVLLHELAHVRRHDLLGHTLGRLACALDVPIDEELSDEHLFSLAMLDISSAFIREMKSLSYAESLGQYTAFRIHGVTPQFVRELRALGYSKLTAEQLVAFRIHGVTSDFVRELLNLGYTAVSSEQLVAMRIHGVTPRFIRELKDAGYENVPVEKLIEMRIHGIDVEFLRRAK